MRTPDGGGDGQLVVSFGALHKAAEDIENAVRKMRGTLDDLERAAKPLVDTWDGEAQQSYAVHQAGWRQAANDLAGILTGIKQAVIDSATDYADTERKNAAMFHHR
jgi:WXG100 family type VII secretion target